MTSSNSHQSYFEATFGKPVNVVWFLRGFTAAAIIAIALALLVFKSGVRHDFCLGLAAGVLVGVLAQTFAIKHVEVNHDSQRSDVDNLNVAR
jgi:preprotein translocase subunit SecF